MGGKGIRGSAKEGKCVRVDINKTKMKERLQGGTRKPDFDIHTNRTKGKDEEVGNTERREGNRETEMWNKTIIGQFGSLGVSLDMINHKGETR